MAVDEQNAPILIMVTAGGRDDAERLGEALVVEHLAASCSVIPTVHSFYFSDGLLQRDHEAILLVRTVASKRVGVMEHVLRHHGHRRPEMLELEVSGGSVPYLEWLAAQVTNPGPNR